MSIDKRNVFEALLEHGVLVHLDPRRIGVVVPAQFTKQPHLILHVGRNLARRIDDLRIDEQGFSCTLSFLQHPFHCTVPWSSVFAFIHPLTNSPVEVWQTDVPEELIDQENSSKRRPAPKRGVA